jgi:hypothetical protein
MPSKPRRQNRHNFKIPGIGTTASQDFYNTYLRIDSFFLWILYMARRIDEMEEADNKLLEVLHDSKVDEEIKERRAKRKKMIDVVKDNRQFFLETALVRHVENYLNYLASLLFEIFTQRPETLKSSEKIEISTVLDCESISDMVRVFAERKVESLSFSSIKELYDFFKERFKLELFPANLIATVVEAIETRNISVHNRCIINKRYVLKTGCDSELIGKRKELTISELNEFVSVFLESVKALDEKARSKLKIKGHRLKLDFE